MKRAVRRAGGAVLAGWLIALALPPWGWWPLAVAGIGLWGWLLIGLGWRARILVGGTVALSHFLVALAWVPEFTLPGYPVLVLLETGFWTLASAAVAGGRAAPLSLAGALTLAEAARYNSPFEGLPLGGIDLGQAGGPFLEVARLGGGYAVTLAAALLGAALALSVGRRPDALALAPAALAVLLVVAGYVSPDGRDRGDPLRAAVIQGGGPVGFRGVDTDFREVFNRHLAATSRIKGPVDVVLWPENSLTVDGAVVVTDQYREVLRAVNRTGAAFVVGVVEEAGPRSFWNRAYLFDPEAADPEAADPAFVTKAIRVPFGEYIPHRDFFARFADLSDIPTEAAPGRGPGILRSSKGKFAVSISYEVLYAERSREAVRLGAEVMLVPTNAASFRRTQVPGQELAAARLRAVETGRWLLQAAPTGYSGIVDHRGVVRQRTGISEQRVLEQVIPRRVGSTPFALTGPWPALLLAGALVAGAAFGARRRGDGRGAGAGGPEPL